MSRPTIALAGSVSFSRRTLEGLLRHGASLVGVLGLSETRSASVSDFARLDDVAREANVPFREFVEINAPDVVETVAGWNPDYLFVVGLSQLVKDDLMRIPQRGAVGFHPTPLPKGRGRAPVAWLTHEGMDGAATFFVLTREADAGAIYVQEPFAVRPGSSATEVIDEVRRAIDRALDRWLPRFLKGDASATPQDDRQATFFGKRAPEDGLIDWNRRAEEIDRLVRTATRPYPGAYTHLRDTKIVIWRSTVRRDLPWLGVTGRVLDVTADGAAIVQTGDGLLQLDEIELQAAAGKPASQPKVGVKLGYAADDEIHALRQRVAELELQLRKLLER